MVFQSVPVYLDPPNWHDQQPNQQPLVSTHDPLYVIPQPPTTPGALAGPSGGTGIGSIRPGSMADRARLAKLPLPEPGLKCPRCESTNTKFCYFNNYSLSQPRHFCKTCRRYWTRGGALRNVPVGGGCRRNNKRRKGSSWSKSPITPTDRRGSINSTNLSCSSTSRGGGEGGLDNTNSHLTSSPPPQLPFLLGGYGPSDIGLHIGGIEPPSVAGGGGSADMDFQMGSSSSGGMIPSAGVPSHQQPFRLPPAAAVQQFPFLAGLGAAATQPPTHVPLQPPGNELYPFQGGNHNVALIDSGEKFEENDHQVLALSKNLLGIHGGNDQYNWSTNENAWPDLL
ncbi:hypothetical protein Ancab_023422 [Ancistrocladus abbreviatus]